MLFILVIFLLSLLILGHELGHFVVAKFTGMRVEEFGFGFPPRMFGIQKGETTYSINWLPFGGFVRIAGEHDAPDNTDEAKQIALLPHAEQNRFFSRKSASARTAVILAGVAMNFLIGFLLLIPLYMIGTEAKLIIGSVQQASPAEAAGLQVADVVNGFDSAESFIAFIREHQGAEISLSITRGRITRDVLVTPRKITKEGEGALGVVPTYIPRQAPESFFASVKHAAINTYYLTIATVKGLGAFAVQLVTTASLPEGVAGPVGIVSFAQKTASVGFVFFLNLMSIISINLAVMNLLPLPALDGGRFAFIILEKIKGSPVSHTVEAWVNGVGFVILIGLMLLVTVKDIVNF